MILFFGSCCTCLILDEEGFDETQQLQQQVNNGRPQMRRGLSSSSQNAKYGRPKLRKGLSFNVFNGGNVSSPQSNNQTTVVTTAGKDFEFGGVAKQKSKDFNVDAKI